MPKAGSTMAPLTTEQGKFRFSNEDGMIRLGLEDGSNAAPLPATDLLKIVDEKTGRGWTYPETAADGEAFFRLRSLEASHVSVRYGIRPQFVSHDRIERKRLKDWVLNLGSDPS